MKKETFEKILKEKSISFTETELLEIIDDELEKSEQEMDAELIDECVDALARLREKAEAIEAEKASRKSKRVKLSRILLVAVIVILVLVLAIPVGAKFLHIDVMDNVVQYSNNHFLVDLSQNKSSKNNLVTALKQNGMERVYLPAELADCEDEVYISLVNDYTKLITLNTQIDDINYQIGITLFLDNENNTFGKGISPVGFNDIKQLQINDLDILVFNDGENSYIYYTDGKYEYNISLLDSDTEEALSIANTIEEF